MISLMFFYVVVYSIEFQKRGLPHTHILLFLHDNDKYPSATDIDRIINVEIFDDKNNPIALEAVQQFMIHGSCGVVNPFSPYMMNNECIKYFSKKFNKTTMVNSDGFLIYR